MDQTQLDQNQPAAPLAPSPPVAEEQPAVNVIQPELVGVPAPVGHLGPWPKPGADLGNPASWVEE